MTGNVHQLIHERDWAICMVVARLSHGPKAVSSRDGMAQSRETSPYYRSWVSEHPLDLQAARDAIHDRDLARLGEVMERSTMRMHACILASDPPLRYLKGITLDVMDRIEGLRRQGIGAWYTMDAGPCKDTLQRIRCAESLCSTQRFCTRKRPSSGLSWTRYNPLTVVKLRAPGKVILFGEYAVLAGHKALVVAVDRYAQLESRKATGFKVEAAPVGCYEPLKNLNELPLPMHFTAKDRI